MSRKTVKVEDLVATVNRMCQTSGPEVKGIRQGMMFLLEDVLHQTHNYKGFRFLRADECVGQPGVNYVDNMPHPDIEKRFENTDSTRVQYFI